MSEILKTIENVGIVPVIKLDDAKDAIPLCEALKKGGIPIAEITFRTDAAEESIRLVSSKVSDMLVGAGTVTTKEQVDRAIGAGAKFIVSPGFNPKIVEYCIQKNILITPGCTNPSEIEMALEMGLNVLKFFPAEQSGGLDKIKALCAPYTNIRFIPTGGIGLNNIAMYTYFEKIVACGGSFMVKEEFIKNGQFDKITELTKNAVDTMLGFEIAHFGVNPTASENTKSIVDALSSIFSLPTRDTSLSTFVGSIFEVMNPAGLGKFGHMGIKTTSVERAMYHMSKRGVKFNESTIKYNDKNKMLIVYLQDEIADFALHIVRK